MHAMNCYLPPFAPDYGGVCSVLYGGDGLIVIHDASGCTINFTTYDEPRWLSRPSRIFCSCLRELDAVLGDDNKLINKVAEAAKNLNPKFIALVGSSVPMLIGTDFAGIARELEGVTSIPTLGFNASGIDMFDKGSSDAQAALLCKFTPAEIPAKKYGVGLLGDDALVLSGEENHRLIENALSENGLEAAASLGMGNCGTDIEKICAAEVNLVVSASGLQAAEYLWKKYSTPYVCGYPMVRRSAQAVAERLKNAALGKAVLEPQAETGGVLILGERIVSNSLRETMMLDYGIKRASVGGVFTPIAEKMCPGDYTFTSEKEIKNALDSGKFKAVVADPSFSPLVPNGTLLAPLPTVPVSGGIYGKEKSVLSPENIEKIVNQIKEVI